MTDSSAIFFPSMPLLEEGLLCGWLRCCASPHLFIRLFILCFVGSIARSRRRLTAFPHVVDVARCVMNRKALARTKKKPGKAAVQPSRDQAKSPPSSGCVCLLCFTAGRMRSHNCCVVVQVAKKEESQDFVVAIVALNGFNLQYLAVW